MTIAVDLGRKATKQNKLANSDDPDEMLHFIWVFTFCQSTHLGVSSIQRVNNDRLSSTGSAVAECLTQDQGATGSSLTLVTVLWSLEQDIFILA